MDLLIIWIGSVVTSFFMEFVNELRICKDIADAGYKIDSSKLSAVAEEIKNSKPSTFNFLFLLPIFNIMHVMKNTLDYNEQRDMILTNLQVIGVLEEMSDYEKKEYAKKPTGLNALLVPFETKMKLDKASIIETKNENGISSKIFYEFNKKSHDIDILKVEGPDSMLSYAEQKEKITNANLDVVKPAFTYTKDNEDENVNAASNVNNNSTEICIMSKNEKKDETKFLEDVSQELMEDKKESSHEVNTQDGPVLKKLKK